MWAPPEYETEECRAATPCATRATHAHVQRRGCGLGSGLCIWCEQSMLHPDRLCGADVCVGDVLIGGWGLASSGWYERRHASHLSVGTTPRAAPGPPAPARPCGRVRWAAVAPAAAAVDRAAAAGPHGQGRRRALCAPARPSLARCVRSKSCQGGASRVVVWRDVVGGHSGRGKHRLDCQLQIGAPPLDISPWILSSLSGDGRRVGARAVYCGRRARTESSGQKRTAQSVGGSGVLCVRVAAG